MRILSGKEVGGNFLRHYLSKKNTQTNVRTVQILSRRKAGGNFLCTVLKNDVFSVARGTKLVYL